MQTQVVLERKEFITTLSDLPGNRVLPENYESMTGKSAQEIF